MGEKCPTCGEILGGRRSVLAHHHYHHPDQLEDRFWYDVEKGSPDECWEWTGAKESKGYGQLKRDGERYQSNRLSWKIHNGKIGDNLVLHHCDNRACVNPEHLYLGDYSDNMHDMWDRDRHDKPEPPSGFEQARGEDYPHSKLTESDVREIRKRYPEESQSTIAESYGVNQSLISQVVLGKIWSHVGDSDV